MIEVHREPPELYRQTGVYEDCVSCGSETKFWHKPSNTPCCEMCALQINEVQLGELRARSLEEG